MKTGDAHLFTLKGFDIAVYSRVSNFIEVHAVKTQKYPFCGAPSTTPADYMPTGFEVDYESMSCHDYSINHKYVTYPANRFVKFSDEYDKITRKWTRKVICTAPILGWGTGEVRV